MKITRIEPQKNNPDRANIFAEGKFFCGMDWEVIHSLNIKEGTEITPELEKTFREQNELSKCMRKALSLLNYRDRTSFELKKKLKENSFDEKEIELTVNRLTENNYINDNSFLETYINFHKDTVSKTKITQKLWLLGVPTDLIASKISQIFSENDEYNSCLAAMESRIRITPEKEKLIRHLIYKGYKYDTVSKVIRDHFPEKNKKA